MNIEEAKLWAKEYAVRQLVHGSDQFKGLGHLANLMIFQLSTPANEAAKAISNTSTQTSEAYLSMKEVVAGRFVIEVLGLEPNSIGLLEACELLVDRVFDAYKSWAE